MLTLPVFPPRRAWLLAFWTALSLLVGIFAGALLAVTMGWFWFALVPVIMAAMTALGWIWPTLVGFSYRAWNKLAREFTRLARLWVLAVSYYVVFTLVARAGSTFRLGAPRPGESLWTEHQSSLADGFSTSNWIVAYLRQCARSRNLWSLWLLPFLLLLSVFEPEEQRSSVPSTTYTLY